MQTIKVADGVEFAYRDSGAPAGKDNYSTVVLIHGHTYHSGVFGPMFAKAAASGYRLILPNRRMYPGSTPYTEDEAQAMGPSNTTEDIVKVFAKQGEYLLQFIDKLILEHGIKRLTIGGWSLGTCFVNTIIGAVDTVDADVKARVTENIESFIFWDPPATGFGIEDPPSGGWIPLFDESIPADQRAPAFANWISHYFPHPDLAKQDCHKLIYKIDGDAPATTPTFTGVPFPEILALVDFSAGPVENHVADRHFQPAHRVLRQRALFDAQIRAAWSRSRVVVIYGEQTTYNIVWAVWKLEEEAREKELPITVKSMPGVNHFGMYDKPELALSTIQSCIPSW